MKHEITIHTFEPQCTFYQELMKLGEEVGEVCAECYFADRMTDNPIAFADQRRNIANELGDVVQVAFNLITWLGYDIQEIVDSTHEKNTNRSYYAE